MTHWQPESPVGASLDVGAREFQAQFETPTHSLRGTSTTRRPDAVTLDMKTAFALGPRTIGDASIGVYERVWRVRTDNTSVWLAGVTDAPPGYGDEVVLFTFGGAPIGELDLAFDQSARPVVCAERNTGSGPHLWLYFFDGTVPGFVFRDMGSGRTPRCLLDSPHNSTLSDVLVFYVSDADDAIAYRVQRERYETVHTLDVNNAAGLTVEDVAISHDNRLQVFYARHNPLAGTYQFAHRESATYPAFFIDGVTARAACLAATLFDVVRTTTLDLTRVFAAGGVISGELAEVTLPSPVLEAINVTAFGLCLDGALSDTLLHGSASPDGVTAMGHMLAGTLVVALLDSVMTPERVTGSGACLSGELS